MQKLTHVLFAIAILFVRNDSGVLQLRVGMNYKPTINHQRPTQQKLNLVHFK